jgi:hypothetical protein
VSVWCVVQSAPTAEYARARVCVCARRGGSAIARVLTALQRTDDLERLSLAGNVVDGKPAETSEIASVLVNYLVSHPLLHSLVLAGNAALAPHLGTLFDLLKSIRLRELSVAGIGVSDDAVSKLGVALRINGTHSCARRVRAHAVVCARTASLTRLDLSACALSLTAYQSLRGALRRNESVQHLVFDSNASAFETYDAVRRSVPKDYAGRRLVLKERSVVALHDDITTLLTRNQLLAVDGDVQQLTDAALARPARLFGDVLHPTYLPPRVDKIPLRPVPLHLQPYNEDH